jgi:hypothetical protein
MISQSHAKHTPQPGEIRTITRFLWWPMSIGNILRWMETATYTACYHDGKWLPLAWGESLHIPPWR